MSDKQNSGLDLVFTLKKYDLLPHLLNIKKLQFLLSDF